MTNTVSFLPLLPLCLVLGCSAPMIGGADDLRQEIRVLQERILELQRKAVVNEVELARLGQKVTRLERDAVVPSRPLRGAESADPAPPLVQAPARATLPRNEPERVDSEIDPPARRPAPVDVSEPISLAAQALYDRGYTLYHQGDYVEGEASFQRFVQGFPESELADNAQYWIGEARYARHDFRGALAAFRETVDRYGDGNKVRDALLKAGQCLEELGDLSGARDSYLEIQRRFPDSATALIAGERLANLG